jgi:hypothetical protein
MSAELERQADAQVDEARLQAAIDTVRASLSWELSDDDVAAVRKSVDGHLKQAARLRAYPLKNSDEPDFVFVPYRAEG